jgi:hypothetical protein
MQVVSNDQLRAGDVLVGAGRQRLVIDDIEPSSAMPGLLRAETELGVLYLDPDGQSLIEPRQN